MNYISSIGSLISVVGVIVFFFIVIEAFDSQNLFIQRKNDLYLISDDYAYIPNKLNILGIYTQIINLIKNILNLYTINIFKNKNNKYKTNLFIFKKYSLYNILPNNDLLYIYLDRYILSIFLKKYCIYE